MISRDINGNKYEVSAEQLVWRPSAYGIVVHDNRILLVKEHGRYHLPGGGLDLGEDPKDGVIREVREETGSTVADPELIDLATSFFSFGADDTPPNLQHVHSLLIYYSCRYIGSNAADIKLDEYEKTYGLIAEWVDLSRLDEIKVGTTVDWRPVIRKCFPK